ncbi:hypothetical protein FQA39_LY03794 [Lamprigera yunnana]|nr:hypothetical protein FQA39_LY03794 [Lamprigera yunnana]
MDCEIKRIIIDTDPGIDDAHALLIFLLAERKLKKIKIEAITVSAGNTSLENACKNVTRILESENRKDIPVYKGVEQSLLHQDVIDSDYFGSDGLGDVFHDIPDMSVIKRELSPIAICDIINKNPGEITLVCLGPLTNIALATTFDGQLFSKVKECFIMGGNFQGVGNVTTSAEFNFYFDPEAAYIVLKKITCPTTILPLETCYDAVIEMDWRRDVLAKCPKMIMLNEVEKNYHPTMHGRPNTWVPFDGFLAVAILYPNIVVQKTKYQATVELHGSLTRGQVVLNDWEENKANVFIIKAIDKVFYMNTVLDMFQN